MGKQCYEWKRKWLLSIFKRLPYVLIPPSLKQPDEAFMGGLVISIAYLCDLPVVVQLFIAD